VYNEEGEAKQDQGLRTRKPERGIETETEVSLLPNTGYVSEPENPNEGLKQLHAG